MGLLLVLKMSVALVHLRIASEEALVLVSPLIMMRIIMMIMTTAVMIMTMITMTMTTTMMMVVIVIILARSQYGLTPLRMTILPSLTPLRMTILPGLTTSSEFGTILSWKQRVYGWSAFRSLFVFILASYIFVGIYRGPWKPELLFAIVVFLGFADAGWRLASGLGNIRIIRLVDRSRIIIIDPDSEYYSDFKS